MTRPLNLADIIEVMADSVPDRMAFISDAGNRTYAELDDNATRLANHLIANGIHPGDHVAVHAANGAEWAEAFYGVQ